MKQTGPQTAKKTEHDSEKVKEDGTQDSSEPDSQNIYKRLI